MSVSLLTTLDNSTESKSASSVTPDHETVTTSKILMNCQFWEYANERGISSQLWWWDGNTSRSTKRHTPEKFSSVRATGNSTLQTSHCSQDGNCESRASEDICSNNSVIQEHLCCLTGVVWLVIYWFFHTQYPRSHPHNQHEDEAKLQTLPYLCRLFYNCNSWQLVSSILKIWIDIYIRKQETIEPLCAFGS